MDNFDNVLKPLFRARFMICEGTESTLHCEKFPLQQQQMLVGDALTVLPLYSLPWQLCQMCRPDDSTNSLPDLSQRKANIWFLYCFIPDSIWNLTVKHKRKSHDMYKVQWLVHKKVTRPLPGVFKFFAIKRKKYC